MIIVRIFLLMELIMISFFFKWFFDVKKIVNVSFVGFGIERCYWLLEFYFEFFFCVGDELLLGRECFYWSFIREKLVDFFLVS